ICVCCGGCTPVPTGVSQITALEESFKRCPAFVRSTCARRDSCPCTLLIKRSREPSGAAKCKVLSFKTVSLPRDSLGWLKCYCYRRGKCGNVGVPPKRPNRSEGGRRRCLAFRGFGQ